MANLTGRSIIGFQEGVEASARFYATNPATGQPLQTGFSPATADQVERAVQIASEAFAVYGRTSGKQRGAFLRTIAAKIESLADELIGLAHQETALPKPRLQAETVRTCLQLRLFAEIAEEGSWVGARIDRAEPARKPIPRPDIRSMLRPLGPVAVFGASNFPLAFSVAGGDTASALAAGNPVVVKAHPAHPGTSEIVGKLIQKAIKENGFPSGMFSLLFDAGIEVGISLVQHPATKAVAFTGSASGGQALMRLAAERPEPIPCYAEMGSTNPLFILSGAMRERGAQIAQGLQTSFTLGSGQFCTKPGVVFVPQDQSTEFEGTLQKGLGALDPLMMLTHGIAAKYKEAIGQRLAQSQAELISRKSDTASTSCANSAVTLFRTSLDKFLAHSELADEVFGPTTLLVHYGNERDLLSAARRLHGHLTATIQGNEEDLARAHELVRVLETKVGRVVFNGFPTGVEVSHAMVHGGPFPATSDGRSTSVGTQAIFRFLRP